MIIPSKDLPQSSPDANARLLLLEFASFHALFKLMHLSLTLRCDILLSEITSSFTLLIQSVGLHRNSSQFSSIQVMWISSSSAC